MAERKIAKEFLEGLNAKNDATRVSRKRESSVPAKNGYEQKTSTTILRKGSNPNDDAVRENRRVDDALYHGKFATGETQEAYDEAARRYNEKYDAKNDYSKVLDRERYGVKPQKKISNGDDMRVYEAQRNVQKEPTVKNMQKVKEAKQIRDEHSKQKADAFDKNLHKYDEEKPKRRKSVFWEGLND